MTVGLLSNIKPPVLPLIIASLRTQGVSNIVCFLDQKTTSEKDLKIWLERTGRAFDRIEDGPPNLYAFEKDAVPFYFVKNHNDEACLQLISTLKVDLLLNAGTPRKLNRGILDSVPQGVINIHPGILPKYRGCTCVEWAIYNDDEIGNTAHFMTEDYDEGPIISSQGYEFPKDADYQSIRVKTYREGFLLMGKVVTSVMESGMTPKDCGPQGEGSYWDPIPDSKMAEVLQKIESGEYKYMRL